MTAANAPSRADVERWLAQRRPWLPDRLPTNATEAGRRFRCVHIEADLTGSACAGRHIKHTELQWVTHCAGCAAGATRVELLQIEQTGSRANRRTVLDDAFLACLGKMPDEVLAARAGVPQHAINRARCDTGGTKYVGAEHKKPGPINWPVQDWAESIHMLARRLWASHIRVDQARRELGVEQSRWDAAGIGQVPDAIVAARLGFDEAGVACYREACGLPAAGLPERRSWRAFIDWDKQPLGQLYDRDIAERLWVSAERVTAERRRRGIARQPTRRRVKADWDTVGLGEHTDESIAERLGVSPSTVRSARARRGIPAYVYRPVIDRIDWDAVPLGEESDLEVARRLGVGPATVSRARELRGIDAWSPNGHIDWDEEGLGEDTDTAIAARLGVTVQTVGRERAARGISVYVKPSIVERTDWDAVGIGEVPDYKIARRLGVAPDTVAKARAERGIPPAPRGPVVDWDRVPLGLAYDKAIAAALGVGVDRVRAAREERGIGPAPFVLALDELRERSELGARAATWADEQADPPVSGQWMLRAMDGDFGTVEQLVADLGQRFTVMTVQRWARRRGIVSLGARHLVRLAVIAGELQEQGTSRARTYTSAGAPPLPTVDPESAGVAEVFSYLGRGVRFIDKGLLCHVLGWDDSPARRWVRRHVEAGELVKHGRRSGAHYGRAT